MRYIVVLALLLAFPASAFAARDQEAMFQDDNQLIYASPEEQRAHLDQLQALGVDRIRVTVLWRAIAPDPDSRTKPTFDLADPNAYPSGTWRSYDNLVREAYARGIKVNFNLTGPSPLWANQVPPRPDIADNYEPDPVEFARFVTAVGTRFSGTGTDTDYGGTIPRVDYWSIWNEPNQSGWLTPTWQKSGGVFFERSASLYRELLDSAYAALFATGHGTDTILFGDTAPSGNNSKEVKRMMKPLVFVRALYCVDRSLHRLKGAAAKRLGCPSKPKTFVTAHPALFHATGYAHHPYQLLTAPSVRPTDKDQVTVAALPRLTRALDTIQKRYGQHKRFPLYLTEFGYQSRPQDPNGVPLRAQAAYINQAEYIASRDARVRTLSQFLLVDDGEPIGTTFQSGLFTIAGKQKPAFAAYRIPLWVKGSRVWGVLRPAASGARVQAAVQFRRKGSKTWKTVKTVRSSGTHNVVSTKVKVGRGSLRLAYGSLRSRSAAVR